MKKFLAALLVVFLLSASAHAADKIRIGFPDMAAQFVPVPLGQKLGFFREEGLQAEFIRINPRSFLGMTNAQVVSLISILAGFALKFFNRQARPARRKNKTLSS